MAKSAANAFCLQLHWLQMVLAPGASWQPSDPRDPRDLSSHKAESQDAVWGASKKGYALHRVWMGPCGGSDRYLVLVVSLKGSRSYPGSAAYTHCLTRDTGEVRVGAGMRTRERTTLGACSFIPSATQENRRWSLGQNTLQLFPFMLGEDNHYTEKGWIGSLLL